MHTETITECSTAVVMLPPARALGNNTFRSKDQSQKTQNVFWLKLESYRKH